MNVKTTLILFALLILVGGYLFFTRDTDDARPKKPEEHKLVDASTADVTKLVITPADNKPIVVEKQGKDWRLTQPVSALADATEVSSVIDSITGLKSTNQADASTKTGLDQPQFTVELTTAGKTSKVVLGNKLVVGNGVYAKVDGKSDIEVVPADVLDKLDRPASALRQLKLIETPSADIKQVTLERKEGKLALVKTGENWEVTEPTKMPADTAAVTDLLGAITNLRAASFSDDPTESSDAMKRPEAAVARVTFSTQGPATQPSTAPATSPSGTTIAFGGYTGVQKKEVYAKLNDSPFIAKVPATSLDAFAKKPIELRDKKVLDVNAEEVSTFTIATDVPATTQPTSKPAKKTTVTVQRRSTLDEAEVPFVKKPSTQPTTAEAKAASFELPTSRKRSTWVLASDKSDAEDTDVSSFLAALHPLKADKYLESNPATQPSGTYVVTIHAQPAGGAKATDHELRILDRGENQPYVATFKDLTFEISRFSLSRFLESDFKKKPAGSTPPPGGPGGAGFPGGAGGFPGQ